jgi:phosphoglycolate phosphatase
MRAAHNILFDLDGTLVNSLPGIEDTLRATLRSLGRDPRNVQAFRPLVGYPLETVFSMLLGEKHPDVGLAVRTYRGLYIDLGLPRAHPYDGIPEMIRALHGEGRSLFVVTARNEAMARMILGNHNLDGFMISIRGEREGDGRDSKGDLVAGVLKDHDLVPADTVMVGDRRFDAEAALANGCLPVGVTYGYGTREELAKAGAEVLVHSVEELAGVLS